MFRPLLIFGLLVSFACATVQAQLPADAVILAKVKISEKQKSVDLCPVHLVEAKDKKLPTWTHKGMQYRGHTEKCQAEFQKHPEKFAKAAAAKRWENNFIAAMSIIWCPVTDEVNPGGGLQWKKLGLVWESCCQFCNEDVSDEDFPLALEVLKERAQESYKASGGKYVEGATSPVEGAIRDPCAEPEEDSDAD